MLEGSKQKRRAPLSREVVDGLIEASDRGRCGDLERSMTVGRRGEPDRRALQPSPLPCGSFQSLCPSCGALRSGGHMGQGMPEFEELP